MKRILVISWFFPPLNSSEGLVTFKLLKNSEYEYDVITQKDVDSWSYGVNDNFPTPENIHTYSIESKSLIEWKPRVVEYYRKNADKYDIVMTRSMPPTTHEIGLQIKKINPQIKWIASFGDPIANHPYTLRGLTTVSPFSLKTRYVAKMSLRQMISPKRMVYNMIWHLRQRAVMKPINDDRALERDILTNCDTAIFNSTYQSDYMLADYDDATKAKALVLPHSFDLSMYGDRVDKSGRQKKRIVYIGSLDDIRTPRPFLTALKELNEQLPDLGEKVEVHLYGSVSANEKLYIFDGDLLDIVKVKKPVSYLESLRVMQDADMLLHVDANLAPTLDHNIFFAAKLADYMGSGSDIMGITMEKGPSRDILDSIHGAALSYSSEEIKNFLYLYLYEDKDVELNREAAEQFNAVNVAKEFDSFIKKGL